MLFKVCLAFALLVQISQSDRTFSCMDPPYIHDDRQEFVGQCPNTTQKQLICEVKCKPGYIKADETVTSRAICINDDYWEWESDPICKPAADCKDAPNINKESQYLYGQCTNGTKHGQSCTVLCKSGYVNEYGKNGTEVFCYKGRWESIPNCKPAPCKYPPKIDEDSQEDLNDTCHNKNNGEVCIITCKTGFVNNDGKKFINPVCHNGQWAYIPQCKSEHNNTCPFNNETLCGWTISKNNGTQWKIAQLSGSTCLMINSTSSNRQEVEILSPLYNYTFLTEISFKMFSSRNTRIEFANRQFNTDYPHSIYFSNYTNQWNNAHVDMSTPISRYSDILQFVFKVFLTARDSLVCIRDLAIRSLDPLREVNAEPRNETTTERNNTTKEETSFDRNNNSTKQEKNVTGNINIHAYSYNVQNYFYFNFNSNASVKIN